MTTSPASPAPRELGRRASFWVAAAVVAHTLWTSAAPACTYPLYAAMWHLTPTVTTGMFAVYPVMVVLALLLFGSLSDQVGRRLMILAGVASSLLGVGLFAVAPGVAWLYAGRALMGLGVGLSTGPATAALVEFSSPGQQGRANVIATAATALGLGMATFAGGALIQYAPWPLHLNFIAAVRRARRAARVRPPGSCRDRPPRRVPGSRTGVRAPSSCRARSCRSSSRRPRR